MVGAVIVFALACGYAPAVGDVVAGGAVERPASPVLGHGTTFTTAVRLGSEPDEIARSSIILAARVGPVVVVTTRYRGFLDELGSVRVPVHVAATAEVALRDAAQEIGTDTILVVSASAFPLVGARAVAEQVRGDIGWGTGRVSSPNHDRFAPEERDLLAERLRASARAAGATLWEPDATVLRTDLVRAWPIDGARPWGYWLRGLERRGFRGIDVSQPIAMRAAPADAPMFWPSQMMRTRAAAADLAGAAHRGSARARLLAVAALVRELYAWPVALWAVIPLLIGWTGSFPLSCSPMVFVAALGFAAGARWSASRLVHGVGLHPIHDARAAAYGAPGSLLALPSVLSERIRPRRISIPAQPLLWFAVAFTFATTLLLLQRVATSDAGADLAAGAAVMNLLLLWTFAIRAVGKRGWDRTEYRIHVDIPASVVGRSARIVDASSNGCAVVGPLDGIEVGSRVPIVVELPDRPALGVRGLVEHRRRGSAGVILGLSVELDPQTRGDWIVGVFDSAVRAPAAGRREHRSVVRLSARTHAPRSMLHALLFDVQMFLVAAISLFAAGALTLVLLGCRPLIISSGSMRPGLQVGDVVVTVWAPAHDLHVGDIVSFDDTLGTGDLVTHRVRNITELSGSLRLETRGDANRVSEVWVVPRGMLLRRTVWDIPSVGGVISALGSSTARDGLLAGGAVIAVVMSGLAATRKRRR